MDNEGEQPANGDDGPPVELPQGTAGDRVGRRRWVRWIPWCVGIVAVAGLITMIVIPRMNQYQVDGQIIVAGIDAPITLIRDEKGMPYIRAQSMQDATFAQGFAAAQDRLFQMQLMRLQAEGRLTELVGDQATELDIKNRTIGIARVARRQAKILDQASRDVLQSYVDGVNAFIDDCPDDLPTEFALAGVEPDRWAIEDSLSILYLMSWDTSANLNHEIMQQMLVDKVGIDRTKDLLPVNRNPDDAPAPEDPALEDPALEDPALEDPAPEGVQREGEAGLPGGDERTRAVAGSPPVESNLGLAGDENLQSLVARGSLRVGSNNWAVGPSVAAGDHAMVAGDPHLDPRMLPGIMYAVGLVMPGVRAVGAGVPGIPGFIIGRNEHTAIAVTNSYGDVQDLYVETLDTEQENHHREGGNSIPFVIQKEILKIKDRAAPGGFRQQEFEIRFTSRGPVVSDVLGIQSDQVLTLRWAAVEAMGPKLGLTDLLTAKSVDDIDAAIESVTSIVLNFVFADTQGNIGWRVSGRVPIRTPGTGTTLQRVDPEAPWQDNWRGWIPFDEMPHRSNPEQGWLGTANHYTVSSDYPYYFTNYASPSYRYRRLQQRIAAKAGELTVDDHWSIQRDTKNLLAEAVTPILIPALAGDERTKPLADVLSDWDFHDDQDQPGPTVFQTVYTELAKQVFRDELGAELTAKMLGNWYFWQERFEQLVLSGGGPWFDDSTTDEVTETMADMMQRAGHVAMDRLSPTLGTDPEQWRWGRVHTMQWVNPIRRSGFGTGWLGTKPLPANGSTETLYRGWYDFADPYAVTHTAAVRMVVDFGDDQKVRAVMAGGETARTFHVHQKDQIDAYMSGAPLHWWFSEEMIDQHARSRLQLIPQP